MQISQVEIKSKIFPDSEIVNSETVWNNLKKKIKKQTDNFKLVFENFERIIKTKVT